MSTKWFVTTIVLIVFFILLLFWIANDPANSSVTHGDATRLIVHGVTTTSVAA